MNAVMTVMKRSRFDTLRLAMKNGARRLADDHALHAERFGETPTRFYP
jgi:hypothetical protein